VRQRQERPPAGPIGSAAVVVATPVPVKCSVMPKSVPWRRTSYFVACNAICCLAVSLVRWLRGPLRLTLRPTRSMQVACTHVRRGRRLLSGGYLRAMPAACAMLALGALSATNLSTSRNSSHWHSGGHARRRPGSPAARILDAQLNNNADQQPLDGTCELRHLVQSPSPMLLLPCWRSACVTPARGWLHNAAAPAAHYVPIPFCLRRCRLRPLSTLPRKLAANKQHKRCSHPTHIHTPHPVGGNVLLCL